MEQSGRNRWQLVATGDARKRLQQAKTIATGCDQLPIGAHGKEGVDGSSPSEGHTLLISGHLPWERACSGVRSPRHGRPLIQT